MKTIARNHRNFTLAAVAAVCLAAVTAGAHADEAANAAAARTVRYAAINLNTQAGAAVLYNRIRNAAEQVCGDVGVRGLAEAAAAKACVDRAIFASVRSVNNPTLTTEYNTRIGAAQPITMASVR
jgi:UrcA family protein